MSPAEFPESASELRPLPKYTSAESAIHHQASFRGTVPVASLSRLAGLIASPDGHLEACIDIRRLPGSAPRAVGEISGAVELVCQRCLQSFNYPLDLKLDVFLARSEAEEAQLSEQGEAFLIESDRLPLRDLVEDEVLLALPVAPHCKKDGCESRAAL